MPKQNSRPSRLKPQPQSLLRQLWYKSQTKFVAYTQGIGATVLGLLGNASSFFEDPHTKNYLSNFEVPKWVYVSLASLALVTWLAHGREQDA